MDKIKTGIIGTGKVGHLHASALIQAQQSEFVGVYNRHFDKAKQFADHYKVKAYSSIEELIQDGGVEAVAMCTPHPAHAEPTIRAMRAGAHVIVEKPLASSLEDCDAMLKVAREENKKLAMISQRRLYPPVRRIKTAIDEGKLDVPVLGTVNMYGWRDKNYYQADPWRGTWSDEGGGVLVNQAPHQLDILQWYMGPIDELYGLWSNLNHPYIKVEDTAVAVIRFKNGALGNIVVSNSQNPALYGKVAVYGKNGVSVGVQTDGGAMFVAGMSTIQEAPYNDIWTVPGEEQLKNTWRKEDEDLFKRIDPMEYFHLHQLNDFLSALQKDREPMITGEEGRKTVELFTAIYRSTRDNAPIKFPLQPETDRDDFDGRLV